MMRRSLRWMVCAAGWVAVIYTFFIAFVTLVSLTDPSLMKQASNDQARGTWSWASRRVGRGARLPWCQQLKWRVPPGPPTALVSFPGSGNTWLRYLLQQATGYYSGSVYKDYALMKNGFPAESVSNGSVVVVKTHEWGPEMRKAFSRAVLVLRDPYPAIQAEFNRQSGGHIGHAQPDKYTRDKGRYWEKFVMNKALAWMNTTLDWLKFEGPLHLVFYEDLIDNLPEEMRRILEFLDLEVSESNFDCMIRHQDGIYKRRKRPLNFDPFTPKLRALVDRCKRLVDRAVREVLAGGDVKLVLQNMNYLNISDDNASASR
ncbi:WSCD family member AGAP003962-like [Macrobrachium rosenbergii]|uniref:WSCD family member AGAP003962-like n=1 Tax=Macrobrachium rosenbergii TaxID=79674 RepID=UPI0030C7D68A